MSKKITRRQARKLAKQEARRQHVGIAKLQCLALIFAMGFITTQVGKPEVVHAPKKQAKKEKEYLLDGTWLEDTIIGAPIDAAWDNRRTLATKAVLGF